MLEAPVGTKQRRKVGVGSARPPPLREGTTAAVHPVIFDKIARAFERVGRDLKGQTPIGQLNNDDQGEEDVTENVRLVNIRETRYFSAGFAVIGFVLFWIYASFVLVNMNYTYG